MKNRILLTFLGFFLSIGAISYEKNAKDFFYKNLPQDNKIWEKTKEQIEENGFYQIEFSCKKEAITIAFEDRMADPNLSKKYYDGNQDLFSLFEKEAPSSLQRMQELRIELKKIDGLYSSWKLLYVFDKDDIIYEYTIPELGPYQSRYEITRLIKKPEGYLRITYQISGQTSKEVSLYWLKWLKNIMIS